MKRAVLLITGLGVGSAMLFLLVLSVAEQCRAAPVLMPQTGVFPCAVEGTELVILELATYEGPFWEDGTDEEVSCVAGLVVENAGALQAAKGAVILEWEDARMVFELTGVPSGAKILLLEKDRSAFRKDPPVSCYGWSQEAYPESDGAVMAAEGNTLVLANLSRSEIPVVSVQFKNYDTDSGMFIGGITYTAQAEELLPEEVRGILPFHYAPGYSKVVSLTTSAEN